eukprot:1137927-Rhodomonas_salina.1
MCTTTVAYTCVQRSGEGNLGGVGGYGGAEEVLWRHQRLACPPSPHPPPHALPSRPPPHYPPSRHPPPHVASYHSDPSTHPPPSHYPPLHRLPSRVASYSIIVTAAPDYLQAHHALTTASEA